MLIKPMNPRNIKTQGIIPRLTPSKMELKKLDFDTFNVIMGRTVLANQIADFLKRFQEIKTDVEQKKGVYIYGSSGIGKTQFVLSIIRKMGYDPILYDAGDMRNKAFVDSIASQYLSTNNIMQLFRKTPKRIAIVMDEIDGLNRNDQGGLLALSKLIRQKKIKKQKRENTSAHPIFCISNYYTDKKIRDLTKSCLVFELKEPTDEQMDDLLSHIFPQPLDKKTKELMVRYSKGDIRKLTQICRHILTSYSEGVVDLDNRKIQTDQSLDELFLGNANSPNNIFKILENKTYNDNVKDITRQVLTKRFHFDEHNNIINETDRTVISLLYHENVVDTFDKVAPEKSFPFYLKLLDNMCFSDYMYRITFQNQIWQFNEMCYLLKIMYNNWLHTQWQSPSENRGGENTDDIRFTKILTKYSTEYGNTIFINFLCEEMGLDKKDMIVFFQEMKYFFEAGCGGAVALLTGNAKKNSAEPQNIVEMEKVFQPGHNIDRLEIRRMYRFLSQLSLADDGNSSLGKINDGLFDDEESVYDDDSEI